MKLHLRIIPITICLLSANCLRLNHRPSTVMGPSAEDKEILRDAFSLMNAGKKTLGLKTENPDRMLQLIEDSTDKSDQIQQLLQRPSAMPSGEQYLVLFGKNGHFRVGNFTNTTSPPKSAGNDTAAADVFKLVLEKKHPGKPDRMFRRITIIEDNQLKPLGEFPHLASSKRHKVRSLRRIFSVPRTRKKRTKEVPKTKLENPFDPLVPVHDRLTSPNFEIAAVFSSSSEKKITEAIPKTSGAASDAITIEKPLLAHLLRLISTKDEKSGTFVDVVTLAFLLSLSILIGTLIYRWWKEKMSASTRTLELKGDSILMKLGDRRNEKMLDYQPIPQVDLEWQSEDGDWLSYKDVPLM